MVNDVSSGGLSVIIPAFNAERYIAETIRSVLAQEWPSIDIVVVDDGSTDRSAAIAQEFGHPVRVIGRPHGGLAVARNVGMDEARGEFFLHLDADDLLAPGAIACLMARFAGTPSPDVVTGRFTCFHSPGMSEADRARLALPPRPQHGHLAGSSILRASAVTRFGRIDEGYPAHGDLAWWVRAQDLGARIAFIDDIVMHRRIHGANMTLTRKAEIEASRLRIVRESMLRRRKLAQAADGQPA